MRRIDLVEFLKEKKSATFVSFVARTKPKMRKHNLGEVEKVAVVKCNYNKNYANSMRKENPDYVPKNNWGQKETNGLVNLRGQYYLQVVDPEISAEFLVNGKPATEQQLEEIQKHLVNRDSKCKRYSLKNIKSIKTSGQEIELED